MMSHLTPGSRSQNLSNQSRELEERPLRQSIFPPSVARGGSQRSNIPTYELGVPVRGALETANPRRTQVVGVPVRGALETANPRPTQVVGVPVRGALEAANPSVVSSVNTLDSQGEEPVEWTGARVLQIVEPIIEPLKRDIGEIKLQLSRIVELLEQGGNNTGLSPQSFQDYTSYGSFLEVTQSKPVTGILQGSTTRVPAEEFNRESRYEGDPEKTFVKAVAGDRVPITSQYEEDLGGARSVNVDGISGQSEQEAEENPSVVGSGDSPSVVSQSEGGDSPSVVSQSEGGDSPSVVSQSEGGDTQTASVSEDSALRPGQYRQLQREPDLGAEIMWFKANVNHLAEEVHTLKRRQEEILTTVTAHCDFTQGVIQGRPRNMQDSSGLYMEHAVMEHAMEERTNEAISRIFQDAKDYFVEKSAEANRKTLKETCEKLETCTIGQSQRVIKNLSNPPHNAQYVFHFYIPGFQSYIGSGEDVHSPAWVIDLTESFLVVRGVASFSEDSCMTLHVEQAMDMLEQGHRQGNMSQICVEAKVKADGARAMLDVDLGELQVHPEQDLLRTQVADVDCQDLVDEGYDTFRGQSVLVEFKISSKRGQHSVFSAFMGRLYPNLFQH